MVFNGRTFAAKRLSVLQEERKEFGPLSLGIVVASHDPVTSSYVRIKERNAAALDIRLVRYEVAPSASTDEVVALVYKASQESGVVVQLPLPPDLDTQRVLDAMPPEKDVDVISTRAAEAFVQGNSSVMPPVASAINEIIDAYDLALEGKRAVVVGRGRLVGAPAARLLALRGAEVVVLDKSDDLALYTNEADIIVLGAGSPHLLTSEMVKSGVVVFDAGTSESGGEIVGDANPEVLEKASFFTPVPGGIGPVAVVEIFNNLFTLSRLGA